MKPEKLWQRYTKVGDLFVNLVKYRKNLRPVSKGCVEWAGAKHRQGYGMVGAIRVDNGQRIMTVAHRVAMRIHTGKELTNKDAILHTCGNFLCVNPSHLAFKHDIVEMKNESCEQREIITAE